ncbi:phage tail length tape measure family protein [Methylobacterium brachythecii]|uniref:Phage-related minor tail protein n=1 Tax=Methylobacterium brachythecii TaxID=1176177 RepID=A0A7W6AIX3_9HYPH|nr:phage tail length tape measure family protein [Methylobacterium brachythecii]MBB3904178.1 phage-related minor tail protein [Methylobacterium brachythecii]GLS45160.1 hypothetical protein GCM10007884_31490 [Methylobacterium brachythecii]
MATKSYAIRLQAEGGAEIKQAFDQAGRAGQDAFSDVGAAADRATAATEKLTAKTNEAANAARQAQSSAKGAAGASAAPAIPASIPTPSPATQREIEALRRRLDQDYRNGRQQAKDADIIGRSNLSDSEADRLRYLSQQKYGVNDNTSRGLSTNDKLFVKYQAFDVSSQLVGGAPLSTIAVQQGSQVLQKLGDREGGLTQGLKQLGVSATALVTPFTVATTATLAAVAAFAFAAKSASDDRQKLEQATLGLGRGTGASVSDLDALAKGNAEAGKVSTSTAREIVAAYAQTGQIALPVIGDLTRETERYARITGQDTVTATQQLAASFSNLTTGIDDIASKIGGLDDRTKQLILTQLEQGNRSAAQQTAAEYLRSTVEANTAATTGWAAAWQTATTAANSYWEAAKRIAGIKLGIVPEGAQEAVDRLQKLVDNTNINRKVSGLEPLNPYDNETARQLEAAKVILDTERRETAGRAATEAANRASTTAGDIARAVDPNYSRLSQLRKQQSDLSDALSSPEARGKLADFDQTENAYLGVTRAIETLTDANGKIISSEEMSRRQDQLRIDSLKAKTDAEKADVAQRQKAFDLIGKTITGSDARGQIERAGQMARLEAQSKGGGGADKVDEYDRALKQTDDRIRRQGEEAQTYGMTADVVARYRTEQELLTAAKRADRDITPDLTAQIKDYADRAADAAKRVEDLRESSKRTDDLRGVGTDGVRTLTRDLIDGAGKAKTLQDVLGGIKNKAADLAATSISDMIFGKRGSSDMGLLSKLFSGEGGLFSGLKSLFGFESGGYTGPGAKYDVAGIVHKDEYVFDKAATNRIGVPVLEAMRRGVRGYAGGGYVTGGSYVMPRAATMQAANSNGGAPVINFIPPPGVPLAADGPPRRNASGGYDQALRTVGDGLANQGRGGRGAFREQFNTPATRIG